MLFGAIRLNTANFIGREYRHWPALYANSPEMTETSWPCDPQVLIT